MNVLDAGDGTGLVFEEFGHTSLFEDLDAIRNGLREVLETLELSVGDDHTGELRITTMCARVRMSTKARDLGEIETKLGLEPVYGVS